MTAFALQRHGKGREMRLDVMPHPYKSLPSRLHALAAPNSAFAYEQAFAIDLTRLSRLRRAISPNVLAVALAICATLLALIVGAALLIWRYMTSPRRMVRLLRKVDPALGRAAATVARIWGDIDRELNATAGAGKATHAESWRWTGSLLINLLVVSRIYSQQKCGFQLPLDHLPLISDLQRLELARRWTRFTVAPYGSKYLAVFRLQKISEVILRLKNASAKDQDIEAAAIFLGVPRSDILATGLHPALTRKIQWKAGSEAQPFAPWWILVTDGDELYLSVRGSANIDDVATDLACDNVPFLHGAAHQGMLRAAEAVWQDALPAVEAALSTGHHRRLIFCGHSMGGGVALLLGMSLRASKALPLEVLAFAAGPPPIFVGERKHSIEDGLISVINGVDWVPRVSRVAALRLLGAARRLDDVLGRGTGGKRHGTVVGALCGAADHFRRKLALLLGASSADVPFMSGLSVEVSEAGVLRIPGDVTWLMEACAGRYTLALDISDMMADFGKELPDFSNVHSGLHHLPTAYLDGLERACHRLRGAA